VRRTVGGNFALTEKYPSTLIIGNIERRNIAASSLRGQAMIITTVRISPTPLPNEKIKEIRTNRSDFLKTYIKIQHKILPTASQGNP
jgi:hypothetical protein